MPYYCQRACARFPGRDVYLASTALHDRGHGASLYRSEDEGESWERVDGLPANLDRNIDTRQVVPIEEGRALAVVDNSNLYETLDWGVNWTPIEVEFPDIWGILPL